ncbi:MAG: hypothetical protein GY944_24520, partial [bacterium]|nr:hypothetical protein [bacterium]
RPMFATIADDLLASDDAAVDLVVARVNFGPNGELPPVDRPKPTSAAELAVRVGCSPRSEDERLANIDREAGIGSGWVPDE